MGSAYWYYLALNVLSFVMDCSSSAAWITPITQTSSSKGNANATFFWYFESSEPYNKFSVLFGDAEDDVIEIDPTIPETLRFNNAVDLKCGDHVDGTNNVYCVSIEVNMGSGSYVCTVDFPTNPTLTDTAQLTVLDPTCPSPGKCTWEVTDETIDVTPESTSPPVMVMLMVKNVIVAACEASSTNPTCSLKSKRADYTNEEKGQLQLHRCGGTPVDDSIYLNPDAGGCKAICYVLIVFAVILIVAVIVFFILAFIKGIAELRCHGLTKLLIVLLILIAILAFVVLILLIVQGVGDVGFAGPIGKAGLALGIIGIIAAVFVIGFVLVVVKIMGGKGTDTQKGTQPNEENNGTNRSGNKKERAATASSITPAITSSQTETKPRSSSPKSNQVSPGEKPPGE